MANWMDIYFICLLCWLSCAVQSRRPCTGLSCLLGCPKPPTLSNCFASTTRSRFSYGEMVQYECQALCTYAAGSLTSICLTTGMWTVPTLRCTCQISRSARRKARSPHHGICGAPPTKEPMEERWDSVGVGCPGSTVNFTCAQGYTHIRGSKTYICSRKGRWEAVKNNLICRDLSCKRETLPNGQVIPLDKISFHPGENVILQCFENYRLVGDVVRACQNGAWSGNSAKCLAITCHPPTSPNYGWFYSKSQYEVKESVNYTCNHGYTLVGNKSRTCRNDKTWSGEVPVCQVVDCGTPISSDRNVTLLQRTTTYKSRIEIRCYGEPNEIHFASCTRMGMWEPHVDCPRICTRPDVGFSTFSNGANWPEYTLNGDVGYVRCTSGVPMVCHNGTWEPDIKTCFKGRHCKNPRTSGCRVNMTGLTDMMDAASFSAHPNQELFGSTSATCQWNGIWMPRLPECLWRPFSQSRRRFKNSCQIPNIKGSKFTSTQQIFPHDHQLYINCNTPYQLLGSSKIECQNGTWYPSPPKCIIGMLNQEGPTYQKQITSATFQLLASPLITAVICIGLIFSMNMQQIATIS